MAKKRRLPFKMMPASWGLKGKSLERARAEYELTGYELETALAKIDSPQEGLAKVLLDIDRKYDKIDQQTYDYSVVEATMVDGDEKSLKLLELDFKYGNIANQKEYDKKVATLKNEPWVDIIKLDIDPANPVRSPGSIELDWNEQFVGKLVAEGYKGVSDEDIVRDWFDTLCKVIVAEGEMYDENQFKEVEIQKKRRDDGRIEHS